MIAAMISGRLKEPTKWLYTDKLKPVFTGSMIATDEGNRAQVVALEALEEDVGKALYRVKEGETLSVTGPVTVLPMGKLKIRVRTVQKISEKEHDALTVRALESARHELTALHGLLAADGAAPSLTWNLNTSAVVAELDQALRQVSNTDTRRL